MEQLLFSKSIINMKIFSYYNSGNTVVKLWQRYTQSIGDLKKKPFVILITPTHSNSSTKNLEWSNYDHLSITSRKLFTHSHVIYWFHTIHLRFYVIKCLPILPIRLFIRRLYSHWSNKILLESVSYFSASVLKYICIYIYILIRRWMQFFLCFFYV